MNKKGIIIGIVIICIASVIYVMWQDTKNKKLEIPEDFVKSTENLVGTSTIDSMPKAQKEAFIKGTEALVGTTTIDTLPSDEKDAFIKAVEALKAQ